MWFSSDIYVIVSSLTLQVFKLPFKCSRTSGNCSKKQKLVFKTFHTQSFQKWLLKRCRTSRNGSNMQKHVFTDSKTSHKRIFLKWPLTFLSPTRNRFLGIGYRSGTKGLKRSTTSRKGSNTQKDVFTGKPSTYFPEMVFNPFRVK